MKYVEASKIYQNEGVDNRLGRGGGEHWKTYFSYFKNFSCFSFTYTVIIYVNEEYINIYEYIFYIYQGRKTGESESL